jgi:Na+-transporting methylmalonyl-CoA/oxaloacetate decarboxylase gamma subunit
MNTPFALLCAETSEVSGAATNQFGIDWTVLGVVLLGVVVVMYLIRGVGLLASRSIPEPGAKKPVAAKSKAASGAASKAPEALSDELIAVLAAAATATLGKPIRIREISAGKMAAQRNWSQEGRREIYLSHRIR